MNAGTHALAQALAENAELRARLEEAEDTLAAIRGGDVDALVVGNDIYTLDSANAASNKLRRDVLMQMEEAVLAFDNDDHLIFMNPAAERQYRMTASSALGCVRSAVYREVWPEAGDQQSADIALRETGARRAHTVHLLTDGSSLHVESTVSVMHDADGQTSGHLCVIRDISQRVQAEQTLRDATAALARRERQFSTLVENSPDVFARMDRAHRHVYVSPIVERYTGIPPAAHLGKTNAELQMPAPLVGVWSAALDRVFETGQVGRTKFRFTTVRDEERVFDARLMPEFGEDGRVESVLSIASDVTEQERINVALRESRARLQFTLDSARIGEFDIDIATGTARHSLQHDRCFGYTSLLPAWSLQTLLDHVHEDDRQAVADRFTQSVQTGQDWHFECRVVWPDRTVHWIEVHGNLFATGGKPRRMLGIVVDATERKMTEAALRDADRRKDEFLATLAHELRNPLAPIRNALHIMRLTNELSIHGNARTIIERQLAQMVHLVDDLMDVSRISQGKVELRWEQADVASIVQTAIETSKPLIDSGHHALTVRLPAPQSVVVRADVTRLCQIVANLLNNAAKYTPPGGRIEVSAQRQDEQAVISVRDSGVGIPAEMLPRVFDMFAQVDRTLDRAQGGLGIGLALVKRLTEMHGGTIEAHSDGPGQGSHFIVRLPLAVVPGVDSGAEADTTLQPTAGDGVRVLVVDDNVDSAESLAQVLNMLGYQAATAHDGVEAVRAAEALRPDVVLLDIGLPKLSGHDAARAIRRQPWGSAMRLIALSGWGQDADRRRSQEAGFDHHLVKPVEIEVLNELLARTEQSS